MDFKGVASSGPSFQGISPAAALAGRAAAMSTGADREGEKQADGGTATQPDATPSPTASDSSNCTTGSKEPGGAVVYGADVVAAHGSSAAVLASVPASERGVLNSAALWFSLHLDEHTSLSTAPYGSGCGITDGTEVKKEQQQQQQGQEPYWGQALLYLDFVLPVQPGQVSSCVVQQRLSSCRTLCCFQTSTLLETGENW